MSKKSVDVMNIPRAKVKAAYTQSSMDKKESSNEDALFVSKENNPNRTFCVTDGVSNSFDSKDWALFLATMSEESQSKADKFIDVYFGKRPQYIDERQVRKIQCIRDYAHKWWFSIEDVENPTAASYCSVTITKETSTETEFNVLAMGDSCLIHIDSKLSLKKAFPISTSNSFDNQLSVYSDATKKGLQKKDYGLQEYSSTAEKGDILILATDAIAEWILRLLENKETQFLNEKFLKVCNDNQAMKTLIDEERRSIRLQDDDTTFIVIQI